MPADFPTDLPVALIFRNRVKPLRQKYFAFPETKSCLSSAHLASTKRDAPDRHEWVAGSDGRGVAPRRSAAVRTAKACGPDPPMLGPSLAGDPQRRRWLKSRAHRGERAISRKTIAQGTPDCFGCPVMACVRKSAFPLHARLAGAASIRCSLRPLHSEGDR
jgi:hypothetical protein